MCYSTQTFFQYFALPANSEILITKDYVIETKGLPIKEYHWNVRGKDKTIYACLSPEILDILDIHVDATNEMHVIDKQLSKALKENSILISKVQKYENMSFWQRFKFLIKGE